ncbi:uncharacterized protein RCO7_10075 [Rhynchosporium graminicola]|uniref:Uncharacterized protein n=1 Tax=Rhynchosporium graminicola TaxID=2792576 RepID=A0A1E1K8U6_9HELO|nr:uncharacterized protein RCO7_10075 [Rhynchosporium commune]
MNNTKEYNFSTAQIDSNPKQYASQVFNSVEPRNKASSHRNHHIDSEGQISISSDPENESAHSIPFLVIEDPLIPASREYRRKVRHHVMKAVHSRRRAVNKSILKKQTLMQKESSPTKPNSAASKFFEASTTSVITSRYSPSEHYTGTEEEEPGLSIESSGAYKYPESQGSHFVTGNRSDFTTFDHSGTAEDPQSVNSIFYPPIRSTNGPSTPNGSITTPKVSVWMPSRIIRIPNHRSPGNLSHTSAEVLPYIVASEDVLGTSDTTIGSIMPLFSVEVGAPHEPGTVFLSKLKYGQIAGGNVAESIHHMNGLERIVRLRGGIACFGNNRHFQIKVLLIDIIVSAMSNTTPRFNSPIIVPIPPKILGIRLNHISDSPLGSSRRLETVIRGSPLRSKSIEILQRMQDLTKDPLSRTYALPPVSSPTADEPSSLFYTVHLAATIYSSLIKPKRGNLAERSSLPCTEELSVSSPINEKTWSLYPGIYLWIL